MKTKIPNSKNRPGMRNGAALLLAMIFLIVFATIAVGMMTMSTANAQVAFNQHEGNGALICAESGADVLRHWMGSVTIPSMTKEEDRFGFLAAGMKTKLYSNNINNLYFSYDHEAQSMTFEKVHLDGSSDRWFSAVLTSYPSDNTYVEMVITGVNGSIQRNLSLMYSFGTRFDSIFDYGVATRGPLKLYGNSALAGHTLAVEASVYIESNSVDEVLYLEGSSMIAGDVSTTNPNGTISISGINAGIGGETGAAAKDHFSNGVEPTQFPKPNPEHFEGYVAGGDVIDSTTDIASIKTYTNARIKAGTNPSFASDTTFSGVLFIESPNQVAFSGQVTINGIIVGDGDETDDSGTNSLTFEGGVASSSVAELDPEVYGDLTEETGTFIMAPGFAVAMGGGFETLNGAIAANGINFYGKAGGIIAGSVLNYSETPMTISTKSALTFNRSGTVEIPAGFEPQSVVNYRPEYYTEGGN